MKKFSKMIASILIVAMMGMMLIGCGKDDTNNNDSNNNNTNISNNDNSNNNNNNTNNNNDNKNNNEKKETVMLKWIQIGGKPQNNDAVVKAMNDYSIEKIGIGVDIVYLDWSVWSDKVTAMINSGEYWDMMFTNGDKFTSGISLGAFQDITDMLADTPDLKNFIPDIVWQGATINDKIYAVPTYKDSSQTQYWVWDKEVADKYNIDWKNIHTVDDLDPVLYQIQEAIKAGEIQNTQYALSIASDGINGFLMNYESPIPAIGVRYDDKELKVVNVFEQDDIMNVLKHMHKWYNDGLINPDAATTDQGPTWCVVSSGQGFPGAEVSWAAGRGKDVYAEPFAGPLYSTTSILGSVNAISASSKYKKEALQYLQLVNTDETLRNLLAYGIEGTDYVKNEDGTIKRSDNCYSPATYSQATYFKLFAVSPNGPDQWDKVEEWNKTAENSVLLGFNFDKSEVETEVANCSLVMERYRKELYTGTRNPEEAVPALYEALKKAGLETIRTEYQNQINEWKATH